MNEKSHWTLLTVCDNGGYWRHRSRISANSTTTSGLSKARHLFIPIHCQSPPRSGDTIGGFTIPLWIVGASQVYETTSCDPSIHSYLYNVVPSAVQERRPVRLLDTLSRVDPRMDRVNQR